MSHSAPAPTGASTRLFILILGMLAALPPMSTDMYLPGFPQVARDFGVPVAAVGRTLSVFFLGLACGQVVYGPLIDRWGRRRPLLLGIGIYVLATALCLFTTDFRTLMALRALQAVGGACGMIIGRAMVADRFDEKETARALSMLISVMMLAPIVAPILGGFIVTRFGWRGVFGGMLGFGLICLALVAWFIPETLPASRRRRQSLRDIVGTWRVLLANPRFAVPVLVGGLAHACMFAYITASPVVFMGLFGVGAQAFGGLFASIAGALILASILNRRALHYRSPQRLLGAALVVNLICGIGIVLSVPAASLPLLLVPLWLTVGTLGFTGANASALAMSAAGHHRGSASSLVGVAHFGLAFCVSGLVTAAQNGTAYPMALGIAGCGALATGLWFLTADVRR